MASLLGHHHPAAHRRTNIAAAQRPPRTPTLQATTNNHAMLANDFAETLP